VERRWGRLGLPPGWATDRQRQQAYLMARRLAAYYADAERPEKVSSEVPLRVDVGRATITGRVDRLEREPDGRLRGVDYKTGSSKPKADEVATHPQLGTYQLAVEHGAFGSEGRVSAGAALLHLGKAAGASEKPALQQQPPLESQHDPEWAARLVAATAEGMGGGEFPATPGSWCTFCPVKTSCPAMPEGSTLR
jgi:RecB family exonuclease